MQKPIVFFDGVCNLCNWFVDFSIRRDKERMLLFASLQGNTARTLLKNAEFEKLETVILYVDGKIYKQSDAILYVLKYLGWFWRMFIVFMIIPKVIRDAIYRFIAYNRYKWFGKRDGCRMPTEEEKSYIID